MPGICGIATGNPGDLQLAERVGRMTARMAHYPWHRSESGSVGTYAALGQVLLEPVDSACFQPRAVGRAVLDGELFGVPGLLGPVEYLQTGFAQGGNQFLRALEGKFSAALWDQERSQLTLISDRFGMQPLYYSHAGGELAFGSEIKAVLSAGGIPKGENRLGIAQFFTYGHLLGEETMLEGVKLMPPGAVLRYDVGSNRVSIERYWRLGDESYAIDSNRAACIDRIDSAFRQAVERRLVGGGQLGIALSGGLDARTILAAIDTRQHPLVSVCLGVEGSLDQSSAREMARLKGCQHHAYVLDANFLAHFESHLRWMVHLTDGHYLDQCIVVPMLPLYREWGIDHLLRGHAGELVHMTKAYNFSLDEEALSARSETQLHSWLNRRLCAYMLQQVDGPLLVGLSRGELDRLAGESLAACFAESAAVEPLLHRVWHLFISQRLRRETAGSLAMFGSVVQTRIPFMDNEFVDAVLSSPPDLKLRDEVQYHLLKRTMPKFLKIPNANTGTSLGASEMWQRLATLKMKILGRLGVAGYQPYERLGLWLRRELADMVRRLLLDTRCLDRGVFVPDTMRTVVEQHLSNQRNHTFLLMAMMIYELGRREAVDGDGPYTLTTDRLPLSSAAR